MRTPIVAGNWKMHLGRTPAHELLTALRDSLAGIEGIDMAVCPPAPWIADAADVLRGTRIGVGARNVYWGDLHGHTIFSDGTGKFVFIEIPI